MAYWIQEAGGTNDGRNADYRLFYADKENDIKNLPTRTKEGIVQKGDLVAHKICGAGSACFCIENSSLYVLGKETNEWAKI